MDPTQAFAVGTPLVLAVVQFLKVTFPDLPGRYWPAATLAVSLAGNIALAADQHTDVAQAAFTGLAMGLAASGLYSWSTAMISRLSLPMPQGWAAQPSTSAPPTPPPTP